MRHSTWARTTSDAVDRQEEGDLEGHGQGDEDEPRAVVGGEERLLPPPGRAAGEQQAGPASQTWLALVSALATGYNRYLRNTINFAMP